MTLPLGGMFAGYRIERPLGAGAMGSVYLARDLNLDRPVALKVLQVSVADQESLERFRREARALAGLQHPHILTIFTGGVEHGLPYLVTVYATGGTLGQLLGRGPVPPAKVIALLRPIACALDYIHAQGMIHRDVKPQNILLDSQGLPLLADFGIAKLRDSTRTLTLTGDLLGTPAYMAPEYVDGTPVSPATDRYALAVVAYELLVGAQPFQGDTGIQQLIAHAHGPRPQPRLVHPALSPNMEQVLLQGLARDPTRRYPSAVAFVDALEVSDSAPAATQPMPQPPVRHTQPAPVVAAPRPTTLPVRRKRPSRGMRTMVSLISGEIGLVSFLVGTQESVLLATAIGIVLLGFGAGVWKSRGRP